MKTTEEIIEYLEAGLVAHELHEQAKGRDARAALYQITRRGFCVGLRWIC